MLNIRSSVQVELVTVLNVEHEVSSVQILHYEEEVLLDGEMLELGQMSPHGSPDRFLPWSERCSKGAPETGSPRLMKGPFSPPWYTPRRHPSAPRLSLESSLRITAHFSSAQLKTPADSLICYYSHDSTSFSLVLLTESGPHLAKAAFPEQLV